LNIIYLVQAQQEPLKILSAFYGYDGCQAVTTNFMMTQADLDPNQCVWTGNPAAPNTRASSLPMMQAMCGASAQVAGPLGMNLDLMPVHFNYPAVTNPPQNQGGFVPGNAFKITMLNGEERYSQCIMFAPANEVSEQRTLVAVGDFGDGIAGTNYPVKVELVVDVGFNVNGIVLNGKGLTYEDTPGLPPRMQYSSTLEILLVHLEHAHRVDTGDDQSNGCTANGAWQGGDPGYVLKIAMNGGATVDGLMPYPNNNLDVFQLYDNDGNQMTDGYVMLAGQVSAQNGRNDGDNYFELCLTKDFDTDALATVRTTSDYALGTQLLAPKGNSIAGLNLLPPPQTVVVDKSRITSTWETQCHCQHDYIAQSFCDPFGLINGASKCSIHADAICPDTASDGNGGFQSEEACKFQGGNSIQFAQTTSAQCAERLPFGLCGSTPFGSSTAQFCNDNAAMMHSAWRQELYDNGALKFIVTWTFETVTSLSQRLVDAQNGGIPVQYRVADASGVYARQGTWWFSSAADMTTSMGDDRTGLSADSGLWMASANAKIDGKTSSISDLTDAWGHGNFDDTDENSCGTYLMNGQQVTSANIVSKMFVITTPASSDGTAQQETVLFSDESETAQVLQSEAARAIQSESAEVVHSELPKVALYGFAAVGLVSIVSSFYKFSRSKYQEIPDDTEV